MKHWEAFALLCLFALWGQTRGTIHKLHYPIIEANETIFIEKWNNLELKMKDLVDNLLKQAMPTLYTASSEVELTPECMNSFLKLFLGLKQYKKWAFQMIDATGKPTSGILVGSLVTLGSYDECLSVQSPPSYNPKESFVGNYCTLELRNPLPPKPHFYRLDQRVSPLDNYTYDDEIFSVFRDFNALFYTNAVRFGLCVPSTCSRDDIQALADQLTSSVGLYPNVTRCEVKQDKIPDKLQATIIAALCFFGTVVFLGTLGHYLLENRTKKDPKSKGTSLTKICSAISAVENINRLLNTTESPRSPLDALHGIRVLTMFWIILCHTYVYFDYQMLIHFKNIQDAIKNDWAAQSITNGLESVEMFFFMGGVLLAYGAISIVEQKGIRIFNMPVIFIRRIWRLLPSTLVVMGLVVLMPLIGSGPFWHDMVQVQAENCRRNWWLIVVFGNNYMAPEQMCMVHSWYISVDLQIFIVGIFTLFIFFKNETLAKLVTLVIITGSVIATGIVTYINKYPPIIMTSNPDQNERLELGRASYIQMYPHLSSYGIGLAVGYVILRHQHVKMPRVFTLLGWLLTTAICAAILFGPFTWTARPPTMLESVAHASLYKVGWCLGMAWITFACATGRAGYISDMLSWRGFLPLSRLTFLMYLLQVPIIQGFYGFERIGIDCNHLTAVWFFMGNLSVTTLLAFLCRLLFEGPFIQLERLFWDQIMKPKSDDVILTNVAKAPSVETCKL